MINNEKPRLRTRRWDERGDHEGKIVQWIHFHSTMCSGLVRRTERDASSLCLFPIKLSGPLDLLYENALYFAQGCLRNRVHYPDYLYTSYSLIKASAPDGCQVGKDTEVVHVGRPGLDVQVT